ncbi:MAG: nucleotidyltransferase family protein [Nitrospinaceae bacterium]|jgi:hypothetical protein|nr:nucleotidyltransferase family protein [Nitrospinaceae bacterium]
MVAENVDIKNNSLESGTLQVEVFRSLAGRYRLTEMEVESLFIAAQKMTEDEWKVVIEESIYKETAGLLCHHLREAGVEPPKILKAEYKWIALSNTMIEVELIRLAPELLEAGARVLLIKGTALHQWVYKNPGIRNFEDSDWVFPDRTTADAAARVLGSLGYKSSGNQDNLLWRNGPFKIEFHMNILGDERVAARVSGLEAKNGVIDDEVWSRCRPAILGAPYLMPAPEDHLLILCAHLMKHNLEPGIWFADIEALLTETEDFDWDVVLERAQRWRLIRPLAFAFRNLGALGVEGQIGGREGILPPQVRFKLAEVHPTRMEAYLLALAATGGRISGEKKEWTRAPLANLLWLSSQQTLREKIKLLWEAAFPRHEVMSDIYPNYRAMLRWWFMVRRAVDLGRLGARVLALSRSGR